MQTLEARSASRRAAGARTPARALEADLLVDAVLRAGATGDAPAAPTPRPRLDLGVVITDTALLERGDESECALLEGYGSIPAHVITDTLQGRPPGTVVDRPDQARPRAPGPASDPTRGEGAGTGTGAGAGAGNMLEAPGEHPDHEAAAVFRRLYRSPSSRELVAMESRARAFPVGLARLIRLRDVTCRTPWCNAVIRQIDHVLPHHRGGPTSVENGQGLCVRCNLAKELGTWEVIPLDEVPSEEAPLDVGPMDEESADEGPLKEEPAGPDRSGGHRWTSPHGAVGYSSPPRVGPPFLPAADGSDPPAPRDHGGAAA
jgi:hypothetical protein